MRFQTIFAFLLIAALTACGGKGNRSNPEAHESDQQTTVLFETRIAPTYAKGFNITYKDGYCLVDIQDPQKENTQQFHYALIPRGMEVSGLPEGYEPIRVPIRKAICMTSLQLSSFIKLDETERVVGITSTRHLFNEKVNRQIEAGQTTKIGIEGNFDNEVIMSINPDLILISPFKRGGYDVLKEMDIPLMPYLGYKETTPLGQAEWIKFTGLLLGEEKKANALFAEIERRYNELKAMADSVETRPMVFSGELRGGNWYAVGGKSFLAQHSDENFSYETLGESDPRYRDFRAFREKGIIYCNIRKHPFYESMPMEPEVVLADLIKAFHPALLPDYQPVYYKRLP